MRQSPHPLPFVFIPFQEGCKRGAVRLLGSASARVRAAPTAFVAGNRPALHPCATPRFRPRSMQQSAAAARPAQNSMSPPGIAAPGFFSGFSATIASVVISSPATDAASCSAVRTTFVGSMIPAFTKSQ
jgi:hypothetical protein